MSEFPNSPRLPRPLRITEQVWPVGALPVVTIRCITYNHVNFIRDAIDGFLMQETTFPVEIIIHDDASTDGTAEIVKDYADKHPQLFRTILQKENQYSKGNSKPFKDTYSMARGEFIAFCEGDDYWTCSQKLEKQVNLLEEQKNLVGCCHEVLTNIPSSKTGLLFNSYSTFGDSKNIRLKHLLSSNWLATCSVLVRKKSISNLPDLFHGFAMGDWPMWIWATNDGAFLADPQPMGFYRCHAGGVWSSLDHSKQLLQIIRMLCGVSHALPKRFEQDAVAGIMSYFAQFFVPGFLGLKAKQFREAKRFIESSSWNQEVFHQAVGLRIQEQQFLGEMGLGAMGIRDAFEICIYYKKCIKTAGKNSKDEFGKLAKSVASHAWVNKAKNPLKALAVLLLAYAISWNGAQKALRQLVGISFGNLRAVLTNA